MRKKQIPIVEGECLDDNVTAISQKYGYRRQRYYQILHAFQQGGLPASNSHYG